MTQKSLDDLATKMRGIDIAMLSTRTAGCEIASRPMSNDGDVD
jgi:general stress protein 26